jgi:hypothetical protein
MYLTVEDVRCISLGYFGISRRRLSLEMANEQVKKHLGSFPIDLAEMWHDLCTEIPIKERKMRGFKQFIMTHFWLWNYPKNADVMASRFKVSKRYCQGEPIHRWVKRIAALKSKKIVWDPQIEDPNRSCFAGSIDGTDFRQEEKQHPNMTRDNKECSVKFKHCACKFEIMLSLHESRILWINGPFRGGKHDVDIFTSSLVDRIPTGKFVVADRGYKCKQAAHRAKVSLPSSTDSKGLANFKMRARCRQETFNARLKKFESLSGALFRHGGGADAGREFFGITIVAVCVIVQYQMDNGREFFAI